jgi:hypothetical protein
LQIHYKPGAAAESEESAALIDLGLPARERPVHQPG